MGGGGGGGLSQYLVLKSNILAKRRLCHFVAVERGLFVWALFGHFSGRKPGKISEFSPEFPAYFSFGRLGPRLRF